MGRETRGIHIPDRLWFLAKRKANAEYTTVTAVIRRLLYDWVREEVGA